MAMASSVSLVELGKDGTEISKTIPKKYLKKRTRKLINTFSKSFNDSTPEMIERKKSWQLDSIEIAPRLEGSIGIGAYSVGGIAGFKLLWERK